MKVAVLGTGSLARFRAQAILADPRVDWLGIASTDRERAARAAAEVAADTSGTTGEILRLSPDAVVVSSSTADHPAQLSACIELGLPVLCEKPLAATLTASQAAVSAADRAGVTLQVGFQRRFDAGFAAAFRRVRTGQIGNLYSLRLTSHDHQPPPERYLPGRGSVFRDLHVHDFDLARWLTGDEVEEVTAIGASRSSYKHLASHGDPDVTGILLRMRSGIPVQVSGAQHDPVGHDVRAELFGSQDSLAVGFDPRIALTRLPGESGDEPTPSRYTSFLDRFEQAFREETEAFLDVAAGQRANPCPGAEAVESLRIAIAAEQSYREHRTFRVSDAAD
jgi:myo-inositol 2-dehydrogenase / D-chiro-inositol 1-dehydrogenase